MLEHTIAFVVFLMEENNHLKQYQGLTSIQHITQAVCIYHSYTSTAMDVEAPYGIM